MSNLKKLNLLELCLSPDLGGLELYMVRASHFLDKKIDVISVINQYGKLESYYKKNKFKYIKIERNSFFSSFFIAKKLAKIIDKNAIDIVHLHWTKDILVAVLAKLFSKQKPKLVQTRNMTMTRFKDDFYHRFLYKNIDLILAVTYQVKEQIEKFIPVNIRPRVEVLYMGADTPETLNAKDKLILKDKHKLKDSFTVGIVGRIEEIKGQHLVIEAVEKLVSKGFDVKALIVGHAMSNQYLNSLKTKIQTDGFEKDIVFTGFTKEVQKLMQICDVIVLATKKETFGLVLIEAMKCNVCIIGNDSGGPLEIIEDNSSGLFFKTKDSYDLREKIQFLLENKKEKDNMAKKANIRANLMFDSDKQFKKLLDTLENL